MTKYLLIILVLFINILLFGYVTDKNREQAMHDSALKCMQQIKEIKQFGTVITP